MMVELDPGAVSQGLSMVAPPVVVIDQDGLVLFFLRGEMA